MTPTATATANRTAANTPSRSTHPWELSWCTVEVLPRVPDAARPTSSLAPASAEWSVVGPRDEVAPAGNDSGDGRWVSSAGWYGSWVGVEGAGAGMGAERDPRGP